MISNIWYKTLCSSCNFQSNPKTYAQNKYLNYLNDSPFQGVKILFVFSFENEDGRTSHSE